MSEKRLFEAQFAASLVFLYVSLYYLTGTLVGDDVPVAIASLLFLPAFVRLLGFLVIGYWSVPALFIAGLFCVDLGLGLGERIIVSAFIATGAPLSIALASHLLRLEPSLSNLTPIRLLWLSLASSFGNSVFYGTSVAIVGAGEFNLKLAAITFIGDSVGTWVVISVLKIGLIAYGRWIAAAAGDQL